MRIIIVGGGSIGKRHITNLLSIDKQHQITLVEPSKKCRDEIQRKFDIDAHENLYDDLLNKKYDAAFVCSPNHLHVTHTLKLAKNCAYIFVEKPISLCLDDARKLIPVIEQYETHLMVGCNLRFHPGVTHILDALNAGLIGKPIYARANFAHYLPNWRPDQDYRLTYSAKKSQGGGILLDDIHEPDYLCWLLGEVSSVSGFLGNLGNLDINTEDTAEYILWHNSGAYSQIHADYLRRDKSRTCELIGTKGTIIWKSLGKNPEKVDVDIYDARNDSWSSFYSNDAYDPNQQYIDEVLYFLKTVKNGGKPMNDLNEASSLMSVLDSVRYSSNMGKVDIMTH